MTMISGGGATEEDGAVEGEVECQTIAELQMMEPVEPQRCLNVQQKRMYSGDDL